MKNISDKSCRETRNTHFVFNKVFRKSCLLWHNVEKYCRAGQATDDNMAHAHYMLVTKGYKYAHRLFNIHYFSTVKMVARTRPIVTLYVHCLSCFSVWSMD